MKITAMEIKNRFNDSTFNMIGADGTLDFDIISDDGRTLYGIRLSADGKLEISTPSVCVHDGVMLQSEMLIAASSAGRIEVFRTNYK